MSQPENMEYLGDGVYIEDDGSGFWLKANHHENPTDMIYLEPGVLSNLFRWTVARRKRVEPKLLSGVDDLRLAVGHRVRALRDFSGVPAGTEGVVDEYYNDGAAGHEGVMVAWDLDEKPLPPGYKTYDGVPAARSGILRDGFGRSGDPEMDETRFLEVLA